MGRSHAHRLIDAYDVIRNLSPIGDSLPANECQVRPLAPLSPFEQRRIWKGFLKTGMEMSAVNIKKFIGKKGGEENNTDDLTDHISDDYMAAVRLMMEQICVAQNDHWRQTSRQAALLWHRVIGEKISSKQADNE
jgi:hypothetical protein